MGLDEKYEQAKPVPNPTLQSIKIKTISICETHACATDSSFNLYIWGTGLNGELGTEKLFNLKIPTKVEIGENVEIKEAKVAKGYTAFKTSGGYLFIFGDINLDKTELPSRMRGMGYIRQVEKVSNYFIRTF